MEAETLHSIHVNLEKTMLDMDRCDQLIMKYLDLDMQLGISRIFSSMGVKPRSEKYTELGLMLKGQREKVQRTLDFISERGEAELLSAMMDDYSIIIELDKEIVKISDEISHGIHTMELLLKMKNH